tara:strand:+ start:132 stop:323 length:192 start_codon:yes stop_codon:yes gene_type:complete
MNKTIPTGPAGRDKFPLAKMNAAVRIKREEESENLQKSNSIMSSMQQQQVSDKSVPGETENEN